MRKNLSLLLLVLVMVFQGCSKDDEQSTDEIRVLIDQQDAQIKTHLRDQNIEAEKDQFGVYWVALEENPGGQEILDGNVADVIYRLTQLNGTLIGESGNDSIRIARDRTGYFFPSYLSTALSYMRKGEKYRFYMPFNVAYRSYRLDDILPFRSIVVMELEVKNVYTTAAQIKDSDIEMIERTIVSEGREANILTGGVRKVVLEEGTGNQPANGDKVSVRYTGSYLNGEVFDSNLGANDAPLNVTIGSSGTITGFQTAVKTMRAGEKSVFYLPSSEAYGRAIIYAIPPAVREEIANDPTVQQEFGSNAYLLPIPPHTPMVFEIEVLTITR